MRTYSKKQDLLNRLKLAAILIILGSIAVWLAGCSEEETPDHFIGTWEIESTTEPKITAEFTLIYDNATKYKVANIKVNNEVWTGRYEFAQIQKSTIKELIFTNLPGAQEDSGIIMYGLKLTNPATVTIDSIYHGQIQQSGIVYQRYYNQVLKKK
jgi:hypothetical protein